MKSCPTCNHLFIDAQDACPLDDGQLVRARVEKPPGIGKELGPYKLVAYLGGGGMGNVYIGAHNRLANRYVAIKKLHDDLARNPEIVTRFFDEARTLNKLKHPHIVDFVDMVEDVHDGAYCVLELLRGRDLRSRLGKRPLDIALAKDLAEQIADALSAVHALGVVHRDLKPDNIILVDKDGKPNHVKLIDFGVAQSAQQAAANVPVGTPAYMAPEQAAGYRVDGRADIYALGTVLFEMVTGQHPFPSASDHEFVMRHASDIHPQPSQLNPKVTPELEKIINKCLQKHPDRRYATATDFIDALHGREPKPKAAPAAAATPAAAKGGAGKWIAGLLVLGAAGAGGYLVLPKYLGKTTPAIAAAPAPTPAPTPAAPPEAKPAEAPPAPPPEQEIEVGPELVELAVSSQPLGATVYRSGETAPLGVTPFTARLLRRDAKATLRFELAGYVAREADVKVEESHEITVKLSAIPGSPVTMARPGGHPTPTPTAPVADKPKAKGATREGTLDPFAQ